LLDGGIDAWDGPLETTETLPSSATFTPQPWPVDHLASADDAAAVENLTIDARQRERFDGAPDGIDPRSGHIPGARSLPCREHLDGDGRLLPLDALRERLAAVGIDHGASVVSYCGSGVTACHNLLVIEHAGFGPGRLYPGSWSQWSHDEARPVETSSCDR
jgi:thiosulfate/3-mercaptopyruvate sulfurtransferase